MELPFITIGIVVIALISIIIGFSRGLKRSFYSFIANLIAVLGAFGITRIVILVMSKRGLAPIGEKVLNGKLFNGIVNLSGLNYTNKFVGTLVLSVCLFYILYLILLLISEPIKRAIFSKSTKVEYSKYNVLLEKKWYIKILAVLISIISCAITVFVLTFSIVSVSESLNSAYVKTNTSKNYIVAGIEKDYSTPIIRKVCAKPVFNLLTKMHDDKVKPETTNEIESAVVCYNAIENIKNEKDLYNNLEAINSAIVNSEIVPEFAAKVISDIGYKNDVEVSTKNVKGMTTRFNKLKNDLLSLMKNSNKDNIKPNTKTATNVGKEIVQKDAYRISKYEEVIDLMKNNGFVEKVLLELFDNANTQNVMSDLIDLCVGAVFDEIKVDVKESYIFSLDYSKLSRSDIMNEAKAISIFAKNSELINKISNSESVSKEELEAFKKEIEEVKNSKIITDTIYTTLNGFIRNIELVIGAETPVEANTEATENSPDTAVSAANE